MNLSTTIRVRLDETEAAFWKNAAKAEGLTLSDWIRKRCGYNSHFVATEPSDEKIVATRNVATKATAPKRVATPSVATDPPARPDKERPLCDRCKQNKLTGCDICRPRRRMSLIGAFLPAAAPGTHQNTPGDGKPQPAGPEDPYENGETRGMVRIP